VTGWEVFRWPEFQAFARRLGMDLSGPCRDVKINMPMDGEAVAFWIEELADDMSVPKGDLDGKEESNDQKAGSKV